MKNKERYTDEFKRRLVWQEACDAQEVCSTCPLRNKSERRDSKCYERWLEQEARPDTNYYWDADTNPYRLKHKCSDCDYFEGNKCTLCMENYRWKDYCSRHSTSSRDARRNCSSERKKEGHDTRGVATQKKKR